jgi:signal recognition particle subunit SRP54
MFGFLSERFQGIFDKLSGRGKLREHDVLEAARQIRLSLLAADVHYNVVKQFVGAVSERAVGTRILESIAPHQQFAKIVHDELVCVLGGSTAAFDFSCHPPLVVMCVGLQGSGKTTTVAKFAVYCRDRGRRPLLVPADVRRPAAIEQLQKLAGDAGLACVSSSSSDKPVRIAKHAVKRAHKEGYDTVIIDTAGRLHIDQQMMDEVREIARKVEPQRVLYVADAMTGQDAVASATAFDEALPIAGVVLTKLDGDARGGAALSIRQVTGKPILFVGLGERVKDFESFHPDRMARRILGMGDVISLVERVEQEVQRDEMEELASSMAKGRFDLDDYRKQLCMLKKLGPAESIVGMLPGFAQAAGRIDTAEVAQLLKRKEALLASMTPQERTNPKIINGSRRKRIARGSGAEVSEVNRLLKEYRLMSEAMEKLSRGGVKKLFKGLTGQLFS